MLGGKAIDETRMYRVRDNRKHDRNDCRGLARGLRRGRARHPDQVHICRSEFARIARQPFAILVGRTDLKLNIPAVLVATLCHANFEGLHEAAKFRFVAKEKQPDARHPLVLLSTRGESHAAAPPRNPMNSRRLIARP